MPPTLVTSLPTVDAVLDDYAAALGRDFTPYRNHVHRVVNLCVAVVGSRDDLEKINIGAAFHDLGIWTAHTFDYIARSIALAREHLADRSRADWIPAIEAMIAEHHKITPVPGPLRGTGPTERNARALVEAFRRADWIDVSYGVRRFGVPRPFVRSLFATWPGAGFHWRLVELTAARFRQHPLSPLPMVKF